MGKSRLSKRREVEAAEARGDKKPAKKEKKASTKKTSTKKKAAPRARRAKAKDAPIRRRLVWIVYSSTMREEGRFLFHDRKEAENKLEQLLSKGKRRYFIQPYKEPLDSEGRPMSSDEDDAKKLLKPLKAVRPKKAEVDEDDEDDGDDDPDDE